MTAKMTIDALKTKVFGQIEHPLKETMIDKYYENLINSHPTYFYNRKCLINLLTFADIDEIETCFNNFLTKNYTTVLERQIALYGKIEGTRRREIIRNNASTAIKAGYSNGSRKVIPEKHPGHYQYWMQRNNWTEEQAKEYISNDAKKRVKKTNEVIKKRGGNSEQIILNLMLKHNCDRATAIQMRKRHQSRDLPFYIKKYGKEIGTEKWKMRNIKWQKSFQKARRKTPHNSSMAEKQFIESIQKRLKLDISETQSAYTATGQLILNDVSNNTHYAYDLYIPKYNLILEFNGYRYHPSPKLSESEKKAWSDPFNLHTYESKSNRDRQKIDFAANLGYNIEIFWEDFTKEEKYNFYERLVRTYNRN